MSVFGDLFEARDFQQIMGEKGVKPVTNAQGEKGYPAAAVAEVIEENSKDALRSQHHGDIKQEQLTELRASTQSLLKKLHETFPDGIIPENSLKSLVDDKGDKFGK